MKQLLENARQRSNRRQRGTFELDLEWLKEQPLDKCPIYGTPFEWKTTKASKGSKNALPSDNSPSIDERIHGLGYTKENSWVISFRANTNKGDSSPQELFLMARAVAKGEMEQICKGL